MIELLRLIKIVIRINKFLIVKILIDKIKKFLSIRKKRKIIDKYSTYEFDKIELNNIPFSYFKFPDYKIFAQFRENIEILSEKVLQHKFNIFCSGEISLEHGAETKGFNGFNYSNNMKFKNWKDFIHSSINTNNQQESLKVSNNISDDYKPIDWQLDIKSGFRWSEKTWFNDIKYGNIPGADIKVPWEIGRFHHIIALPLISYILKNENKDYAVFSLEFQNQIYDFISSNPPEFGCQWKSPMEVGIRAVNWLITYDLFKTLGENFDNTFNEIFSKTVYQHAKFIYENLEWASGLRNNHYFSNVVSLLIICSYLPMNTQINWWLKFAITEFLNEIESQYYDDGGNFENSLSYHFLTTEMLCWGLLFLDSLPDEKLNSLNLTKRTKRKFQSSKNRKDMFRLTHIDKNKISIKLNQKLIKKINNIFYFTIMIQREDGSYAQIGDNDSGRFLILTPYLDKSNSNKDFAILISLIKTLTNEELDKESILEFYFAKKMSSKNGISLKSKESNIINSLNQPLNKIISFPYSGLHLFRNKNYQSEIKCSNLGQWGKGGHDHNDQLSITIAFFNLPLIVDPGTYVYTPFKELRNKYRSVHYHNTLSINSFEQNPFDQHSSTALFWFERNKAKPKVIDIKDNLFIAEHYAYPKPHKRMVNFNENSISGTDICEMIIEKNILFHLHPDVEIKEFTNNGVNLKLQHIVINFTFKNSKFMVEDYYYSSTYGCQKPSKRIILKSSQNIVEWEFRLQEK